MIIASKLLTRPVEEVILDLKVRVWWRAERTELMRKIRRSRQVGSAVFLSAVLWVIHALKELDWGGCPFFMRHVRTPPLPFLSPCGDLKHFLYHTGLALCRIVLSSALCRLALGTLSLDE